MPREGSSTSKTFPFTDAPVPYPQGSTLIASWDVGGAGEAPRPIVLIVVVEGDRRELPAGVTELIGTDPYPEGDGGQIVLKYGAGAAARTIVMDLKPGSYQLPPCEAARCEVSAWSAPNAGREAEIKVSACFVEGVLPASPARPVYSYQVTVVGGGYGNNRQMRVPPGARWVQLCTSINTEYARPILRLYAPGVSILQDLDADSFAPPGGGPYELGGKGEIAYLDNNNAGTQGDCFVRFYLEL